MSGDELLQELSKVYTSLQKLEEPSEALPGETKEHKMSLKKAFQADQVSCMMCGKTSQDFFHLLRAIVDRDYYRKLWLVHQQLNKLEVRSCAERNKIDEKNMLHTNKPLNILSQNHHKLSPVS
jgi:predicted transcriptional regulator